MKELKNYIHLYIGCKCTYPDTDPEAPWIVATLTGCTIADGVETTYLEVQKTSHGQTHGDYLSWKSNGHHNSDALHLKLILRPLSDLTSKEQDELWHADEPLGVISMYNGDNNRKIVLAPERMAYLLSKGFDLFGLRESGLCVYEQDL